MDEGPSAEELTAHVVVGRVWHAACEMLIPGSPDADMRMHYRLGCCRPRLEVGGSYLH